MSMDLTGATLAQAIVTALGIPTPPGAGASADQIAAYQSALASQLATWTTICNQILTYVHNNASVAVSVPATGLNDSTGHACTGTASGTGTIS